MFGSDWPICLYGSSYEEAVDLVRAMLASVWSPMVESAEFGRNAARFHGLEAGEHD